MCFLVLQLVARYVCDIKRLPMLLLMCCIVSRLYYTMCIPVQLCTQMQAMEWTNLPSAWSRSEFIICFSSRSITWQWIGATATWPQVDFDTNSSALSVAQVSAAGIGTQKARLPSAMFYAGALLQLVLNMARLKLPWVFLHRMEFTLAESSSKLFLSY